MKLHALFFKLLILTIALQTAFHFWPNWSFIYGIRVDYLSPTIYLSDIIIVLMVISWLIRERNTIILTFEKKIFLISLFLFIGFTSLLVAKNIPVSIYKLIKLVEMFFLGIYVSKNYALLINKKNFINLLVVVVVFASLLAIGQFIAKGTLNGAFRVLGERTFSISSPGIALVEINGREFLRPYATFPHPNVLAGIILLALILVFGQDHNIRFGKIVLGLGLITIFITFSLSAFVTLFFLIISLILMKKRLLFLFIKGVFIFSLFISFLTPFLIKENQMINFLGKQSILERVDLAKVAIDMILKFPITGVGINNFIVNLPEFVSNPRINWILQPVHNIYLLTVSELGIPVLLLVLWFIFLTIKKIEINNDRKIGLAFMVIMITGTFDHYWLTLQQPMILTCIVLGIAWRKNSLKTF